MRGIVFEDGKAELSNEVTLREIGPGEVRVKMVAAGVCHSDVSVLNGTIPYPTPLVMGHEGAGEVIEVGDGVTNVTAGDHVVMTTLASCGMCNHCNRGMPTHCPTSIGNMTTPFTVGDKPAYNFAALSVFADEVIIKSIQAIKIDKEIPLTSASLIGCGVITGVGTVFNQSNIEARHTAAVFGVGGIGLNVLQALRIRGARRIIAVDTLASKESLAMEFGATDFVNAADGGAVEAIKEIVKGPEGLWFSQDGVDFAYDCVGHPKVVADCVDATTWGGTTVVIGVPGGDAMLGDIPINKLNLVDRKITGCRYGSTKPQQDIPLIVDLYKQGRLKLDELVTATYPLEEFHTVVSDMHEGKLARGVLTFD